MLLRSTDLSQDNFIYFLNSDNTLTAFQFAHEVNLAALTPITFNPKNENKVSIVEELEKAYKNSATVFNENKALQKKLKSFAIPESYQLP